ncbi:lipase maturation factor family protein [Sorangium sp. So ce327]|uniref:lipase maturation factor family protein n=1 Tax=Sorangium sp. So ce327 TaxID=3133301 RepID=UPI003F5E725D
MRGCARPSRRRVQRVTAVRDLLPPRAGLIKLRDDPRWRDLTCLVYHDETQPVPDPPTSQRRPTSSGPCS